MNSGRLGTGRSVHHTPSGFAVPTACEFITLVFPERGTIIFQSRKIAVVTNDSGDFQGEAENCEGRVVGVLYKPDDDAPLAASFEISVRTEAGQPVLTFAPGSDGPFQRYPETPVHSVDGALIPKQTKAVPVGHQESVFVSISNGGPNRKGTVTIISG